MILDYEVLKLIWWLLIGVLLIGFVIMDGYDLGAASLLRVVGKTDEERRVVINTVGPHWDGNQVWLITAGGALFAAWPAVYATAFSGFYFAMMLVLFALILRPVGFDYRSKIEDPRWRNAWDWGLVVGGAVPSLLFGVAFGNLILGVPFEHNEFLRPTYTGGLLGLLNPFALLVGVVSLSMLVMHGAVWLQLRAAEPIESRARALVPWAASTLIVTFAIAGIWVAGMDGFRVVEGTLDPAGVANPLLKEVEIVKGAWLMNYSAYPWMIIAPVLGFAGAALTILFARVRRAGLAFITSSTAMAGVILTAGFSMFPFVMPSITNPGSSLTAWDAVSSHLTLTVMFWAAVIFVPIILFYTTWCHVKMWGKVSVEDIRTHGNSIY